MPLKRCALKGSIDAETILHLSKGFTMIISHAFYTYYAHQNAQTQQAVVKPSPHTNSQTEPPPRPRRPSMDALGQGRLT